MNSPADMHRLVHFIWDFDGTLFDTYPVIIEDLRGALAVFEVARSIRGTNRFMMMME